MMGLPGAGKTLIAQALERELGLRRICRDTIRRALFPRCSYSFVEKRAAFRSVLLALEINCLLGEASVVDGITFSRRQDFDQIEALATANGFDTLPLLIDCPPALARARFVRDELARKLGGDAREESFRRCVRRAFPGAAAIGPAHRRQPAGARHVPPRGRRNRRAASAHGGDLSLAPLK